MRSPIVRAALLAGGAALSFLPSRARAQDPAPSALAVEVAGRWEEFWRSSAAPARWEAPHPSLARALSWSRVQRGVEVASARLRGSGEAWRTRLVVVRIDPAQVRFRAVLATDPAGGGGRWSIADAPGAAIVAFNAGQFGGGSPWGWVVEEGAERYSPGAGPLAPAFVARGDGTVGWLLPPLVPPATMPRAAFQSYPALLVDGAVPAALRHPGSGVDLAHRDARFTLCTSAAGAVLLVLTRFDALAGALDALPFGLTTPEQAAVAGALGCRTAVALDGGISAQLLVRDDRGAERRFPGMRRVPLGMLVMPR